MVNGWYAAICDQDFSLAHLKSFLVKGFNMRFFPREEKFFDQFERLINKIEEGGNFFMEMLENYEDVTSKVAKLKEIEHEADIITHKTYEKMHRTFLTPLDREDIYALVNKMDSILDMIEAAAIRMHLYNIKKPAPEVIQQAKILNKAIAKIKIIIHGLRDMKNAPIILEAGVDINTLENEGDVILRNTIARLFEKEENPFELIKWKEIFERIEEAIDMCEDVSNIAEGIVLKHG
jgi:predicted phosphate transport protein (TIGR00153 family)